MRRFDVGVGLHGDHIGGEREAARALLAGDVDAACMIDANHLLFVREGTLPAGSTRVLAQTDPYDHCNMTVLAADGSDRDVDRFAELLLSMSYADPVVRPLLDLEGLTEWRPGRTSGYAALERAVDETGFYDAGGRVTATDYRRDHGQGDHRPGGARVRGRGSPPAEAGPGRPAARRPPRRDGAGAGARRAPAGLVPARGSRRRVAGR